MGLDFFKFTEFTTSFIDYSNTDMTLVKLVLFALIAIIVTIGIRRVKFIRDQKFIQLILALSVSTLAVYYFPEKHLDFVLIPYKSLGFLLINAFPFLIILFITQGRMLDSLKRRIIWIVYLIFFGMTWYNNYKIFLISQNQIMAGTATLILFMILFDKQVNKLVGKRLRRRRR